MTAVAWVLLAGLIFVLVLLTIAIGGNQDLAARHRRAMARVEELEAEQTQWRAEKAGARRELIRAANGMPTRRRRPIIASRVQS